MRDPGGNFQWCSTCGRRRCQPPHVQCAGCRPKETSKRYPRTQEASARKAENQRKARRSCGVLAGFDSW